MKYPERLRDYWPLVLIWLSFFVFLSLFWMQVQRGLDNQRRIAEQMAYNGLLRTSHALATQTKTMFSKLEYIAHDLSEQWPQLSESQFRAVATKAKNSASPGAILNVLVAGSDGRVQFSGINLRGENPLAKGVSIADREHFKVHFQRPLKPAFMYISKPILGRISQGWAVILSHPIEFEGQRVGVLVISVSARYLSQALKEVYSDPQDAALMAREDGEYLARAYDLEKVLGKSIPSHREFIAQPTQQSGYYHIDSPIDGVPRFYAWHRVQDYPVVVSVGVSTRKALASLDASKAALYRNSIVGSFALFLLMFVVSYWQFKSLRQAKYLRIAHQRLHATLHSTHHGSWSWSWHPGGPRTEWDDGAQNILNLSLHGDESSYTHWQDLLSPEDRSAWTMAWHQFMAAPEAHPFAQKICLLSPHGSLIWIDVRARVAEKDRLGRPTLVVGTYTDVTQSQMAAETLRKERKRLDVLLEQFPGGVLVEDQDGKVVLLNQRAMLWLGIDSETDAWLGQSQEKLTQHLGDAIAALKSDASETKVTIELHAPEHRVLEITRIHIEELSQTYGHVWLLYDVTDYKRTERQLATLASTDALTNLPNRRAFMAALERAMQVAQTQSTSAVVLMMDVDFFKRVNDTHGHSVGDDVLKETAKRIRACLRQNDVCGRIGGEEFAVLLENANLEIARQKAQMICSRVASTPFETSVGPIHVTLSIGLASSESHDSTAAILAKADKCLYEAKHQGRNRVVG